MFSEILLGDDCNYLINEPFNIHTIVGMFGSLSLTL